MGRPPKAEAVMATKTQVGAEDFVRLRDSVVTGLATLQAAIQELSRAYISHSNTILTGGEVSTNDLLALSNPLGNGGLGAHRGSPVKGEPGKRTRKTKRAHDPNMPKRPLTPYFLYMQTARPVITQDLGTTASKGKVSEEGTRRWQNMPVHQKELWKGAYQKNLDQYKAEKAAYLVTLKNSEGAAAQLAAENAELLAEDDDDQDQDQDHDDDDEADADVDPDVDDLALQEDIALDGNLSPPASPRANKRQRGIGGDAIETRVPVKETQVFPPGLEHFGVGHDVVAPEPKRRKRRSRAEMEADSNRGEDKERRSRRKRKSDAVDGA